MQIILPRKKSISKSINIKRYSWDYKFDEDAGYYVSENSRPSIKVGDTTYAKNFDINVPLGTALYFQNSLIQNTDRTSHVILNGKEVDVSAGYYFTPTENCVVFGGGDYYYSNGTQEQYTALLMYASKIPQKTDFRITLTSDLKHSTSDSSFIYIDGQYITTAGTYTAPADGTCFLQLGSGKTKIISFDGQAVADNAPRRARLTLPFFDMTINYSYTSSKETAEIITT